ncbi:fibrinogen-like protein A [Dysidea avara]|uniref:fibrinogen-like protein A n=1 Tax=Dysidea avara TaxID=196820 RepID=UPI003329D52F
MDAKIGLILTIVISFLNCSKADQLLDNCMQYKTQCSPNKIKNCCDLTSESKATSGIYQMNSVCGNHFTTSEVYCDMDTAGGGWTVIQRNGVIDGFLSPYFNKNWVEYENGFGTLNGSKFWFGLKALNYLTNTGKWELRVDCQLQDKTWTYYHYTTFSVGDSGDEYPLTVGGFTGIADQDVFAYHNGMKFSTFDNDNDLSSWNGAAVDGNGWWFNKGYRISPNWDTPVAYSPTKGYTSFILIEMKIRPLNCVVSEPSASA